MQTATDLDNAVYVSRQPILDDKRRVFGYELLYRDVSGAVDGHADDPTGARLLTDAVLSLGLNTLTQGLPAFVNLPRGLLVSGAGTLLSPGGAVLQIRKDITVDAQVVGACRELHAAGHTLALVDLASQPAAEALLPFAKFVKVDVSATPVDICRDLVVRLKGRGVRLIAEQVETLDAAREARDSGYTLFQGYFFCQPSTVGTGAPPPRRLAYLHLLAALNRPNLSMGELEDLVKHDVSLSHRVLRCINSAAFGLRQEVRSIRHALVLLGLNQIRKWASVWSLAGLNGGGTPETVAVALIRARCCELLGASLPNQDEGEEYFLLGLCSLLDVILNRPMTEALADLPLSDSIRDALFDKPSTARSVLNAVVAYEQGDWDEAGEMIESVGIAASKLPAVYRDSLKWARDLSAGAVAA